MAFAVIRAHSNIAHKPLENLSIFLDTFAVIRHNPLIVNGYGDG
jgi:hypothetical protein